MHLAYLRNPHILIPAARLKHFITQFDLETQIFELLRYFGPQEHKENINTLGKNSVLDIHVPSVQTETRISQSQTDAVVLDVQHVGVYSLTLAHDIKPPWDSIHELGWLRCFPVLKFLNSA